MREIVNIKMLDPHLQKFLNAYGVTAERDPESARRTQAGFMAELDKIFVEQAATKPAVGWVPFTAWFSNLTFLNDDRVPSIGKRTVAYVLITLVVFGVFLFGSVGITAYAASSSLPGDTLYPFKTTTENAWARWTPDSAAQAHLYLDFAGRRLVEIQALIREGRFADIDPAASEFERDVQNSLAAVENLSQIQPTKAVELKMEIATVLRSDSDFLTQMLADIPGEAQSAVRSAIRVSKSGADWLDTNAHDDAGNNDEGNIGGWGVDNDCNTSSSGNGDDDHCGAPSRDAGGPIRQIPEPPATNSESNDDDNSGISGGDDDDGDGDDDNDDD